MAEFIPKAYEVRRLDSVLNTINTLHEMYTSCSTCYICRMIVIIINYFIHICTHLYMYTLLIP